jgi:hypothetical protein
MIDVPQGLPSRWWLRPLALILGLGVGIGLGLLVSWVLLPVEYTNVAPSALHPSHRAEYIVLIGQTYALDKDLASAQARLAGLGDPATMGSEVATIAERLDAQGGNPAHIQALAELAFALGYERATLAAYLSDTTAIATWTPLPSQSRQPRLVLPRRLPRPPCRQRIRHRLQQLLREPQRPRRHEPPRQRSQSAPGLILRPLRLLRKHQGRPPRERRQSHPPLRHVTKL